MTLSIFRKRQLHLPLTKKEKKQLQKYSTEHARKNYSSVSGRARNLVNSARRAAEKQNLPFDITKDWVEERVKRGYCEVTQLPFSFESMHTGRWGAGSWNPYAPSLDKKVQERGYTKDNVRVVIFMYNLAKSTWTDRDVLKMAKALTNGTV